MVVALPLVGEIAVEVVFIFALLLVLGAQVLVKLLAALFSYVPFIGGWVQSNIEGALGGALSRVSGWLWSSAKGVVSLIWRPVTWFAALVGHLTDGLWQLMQMGARIVTTTIPNALHPVWNAITNAVATAYNAAHWALSQAQSFAAGLYNRAVALVNDLRSWVWSQIVAVVQDIQATAAQLWANVVSQIHAVQGWVVSAITAVRDALVVAFNHTIGAVWDQIAQRFTVTEQWVDQQIKGIEAELPVIESIAIDTAVTAVTPAIAHALDVAVTAEATITKYLDECGNNLCGGLNHLSTLLQQLGKLFEDGALFALVVAAVHDPAGLANDVESVLRPVVDDAATAFRDVSGLAA